MYQISSAEKKQFNSLGYLAIPIDASTDIISNALAGARNMKVKAITDKYPLTRTYYDHITNLNLAAIEAPFNKLIIDNRVKILFEKLNLGALVCSLMEWNSVYCSLARLFTMGDYNYRGNWHRDCEISSLESPKKCTNIVQVELYLEEQYGFRYLKKEYDLGGKKSIIKNLLESEIIQSCSFPLLPPKESFNILGGKAGTILFFNPTRMHQGSTNGSRIDFHMRFEKYSDFKTQKIQLTQNSFLDFKTVTDLGQETNIDEIIKNKNIPMTQRRTLRNRLSNSINYWTCFHNFIRIKKLNLSQKMIPLSWTPDLLSNTAFQK